jgi:glycosyltransferase involved in cell wall biosynthesis
VKILHVPFTFYPDAPGGTEVYVESLARYQIEQGVEAEIAAPGPESRFYWRRGLPVNRFATGDAPLSLRDLYGEGDKLAADAFVEILDRCRPDLVHLHAFTSGVSLRVARAVKAVRLPLVYTVHTPTASCSRGTMMRWGTEVCDGVLDARRCSRCTLQGKGLNGAISWILGSVPPPIGRAAGAMGLAGGPWTAFRMSELVSLRHDMFRALMAEVDHVVAVCQWMVDTLLRNGVDASKISLSRQGLSETMPENLPDQEPFPHDPIRLAFLGRVDATKGLQVLIEAFSRVPQLPISLDIFGVVQGAEGERLAEELRTKAAADSRIRFLPPIASSEVVPRLRQYDALAVPSQWLETGPLVVYEAFAAGIPVLGSRLGGIAELVEHGRNGLLIQADSAPAWAEALGRITQQPGLLPQLRAGIVSPRTMETAAREMLALYDTLLARSRKELSPASL